MSGGTSRSELDERPASADLAAVRAVGGIAARFRHSADRTIVARLGERGGYRLAQPDTAGSALEALQVNTGGGVVGGDSVELRYALGGETDVVHTSSSAERIYRSDGAASRIAVHLELGSRARLDWLPQQTILYQGARLERRIEVDMAASARLLLVEVLTFGRPASPERAAPIAIDDQWRVRRAGRLVFAEALKLAGDLAGQLARPAVGGGARAAAVVLLVAPEAPDLVAKVRRSLERSPSQSGVSAWSGLLALRALSESPGGLIRSLVPAIEVLAGRPMPRVWAT